MNSYKLFVFGDGWWEQTHCILSDAEYESLERQLKEKEVQHSWHKQDTQDYLTMITWLNDNVKELERAGGCE